MSGGLIPEAWRERLVSTEAASVARIMGIPEAEARELIERVGKPAPLSELSRDGVAIAAFTAWLDCFAAAQAMSATYKRARFTARSNDGKAWVYLAGTLIERDGVATHLGKRVKR